MKITSPDFNNNERIPVKFTGDGEDINPNLILDEITKNTKSLVLIVDDPDAPRETWVHWIVFDINPKTREIKENSVPDNAIQGENSWKRNDYRGPSPPSGTHKYVFKLFALDIKLNLNKGASIEKIKITMQNHILDKAELIGIYSRF